MQFNYDPRRDVARMRVPTLVLLGALDVVFPPDTVAARMREVYAGTDLTLHIIPAVSHGMTERQTSGGQAFRWAISERFVELLTEWVVGRTAPR